MNNDFLSLLDLFNKVVSISKETLKDKLIDYFIKIGDDETAQKIINKGLPDSLHFYGKKTTCFKSPIIFIQTSPIVPKGTILAVYNDYPKLAPGGTVYVNVGEKHTLNIDGSKEDPEYLNKMAKLFNESETVINNFISK